MNTRKTRTTILLVTTAALAAFTGCSKSDRDSIADTTKDAYNSTKDAVAKGWEDIKSYTFEKRSDFTTELKARQAAIEADISDMKADYSAANASASRKDAWEELKNADSDYKEKLSALGNATADTWDAARDRAAAAWDRLQEAYHKARVAD
jgi:hypothetical protein